MKKYSLSIIIPTYNALSLLKKHLQKVIDFSKTETKIIIADDGSTDGTIVWVKGSYPNILCLHNLRNIGFTKSVNLGVKNTKTDLFVLLNNDVAVTKDYLSSVIKWFENPEVFAVTLNETHSSWPLVTFNGKLNYIRAEDINQAHYS